MRPFSLRPFSLRPFSLRPFSLRPFSLRPFSLRPFSHLRSHVVGVVLLAAAGCGPALKVSDRTDFGSDAESVRTYCSAAVVELHLKSATLVDS